MYDVYMYDVAVQRALIRLSTVATSIPIIQKAVSAVVAKTELISLTGTRADGTCLPRAHDRN